MTVDVVGHVLNAPRYLQAIYAFAALVFLLVIYLGPYAIHASGFSNLKGPPSPSFLKGNVQTIIDSPPLAPHKIWVKEYGHTYRYRLMANAQRMYTQDPLALQHILSNPDSFPKPSQVRDALASMLGHGLLVAEGHDHKRQRRLLNSSFSPSAVRGMVPIFFDKAYELRDKMAAMIEDDTLESSSTPAVEADRVPGARKIDVLKYIGQATLDVIGVAGFDYDFHALSDPSNELANAYSAMFAAGQSVDFLAMLAIVFPLARHIPTARKRITAEAKAKTQAVGRRMVEEKKRLVAASYADGVEKGSDVGKDLLSILIKANMASDLSPDQRLDDDEVLAQITTFMLAGNETSSTGLTWILYLLSQHPEAQAKLRKELMAVDQERLSMDEINSLPYLDAVVREGLRVLAPAPNTIRECVVDGTVIPFSRPIQDRHGKMIDSITVNKGVKIFLPILNVNTSPEFWGEDAEKFNPDRFLDVVTSEKDPKNQVPGVWGNMLTFLGGTRNCIGYRFALAEMKSILFVLIRSFEFEELPSKPVIEKKSAVVMRPRVVGEESSGLQMPLLVKPIAS